MSIRFRSYDDFRDEILRGRAGPMTSAVEEVADEVFRQGAGEFDSLWDSADDD